jgi:CRP/FNR family cyclic AMP-dependent transcriptional regulator
VVPVSARSITHLERLAMTPSIIKPPPPAAPWIQPFVALCHRRRYTKGTEVLHQGDDSRVLYYLLEGSVVAFMEDSDGREIILAYLNKGEFIGEMGLFLPEPRRSVMVRARADCQIAEISYQRLEQLFEADLREHMRAILYAMGGQLARRLLNTSNKVGHLAFLDVTGRIARTLLDLCKQPDAITHPDGMQIRITRQEIGRIVGCSREMAGRVLKNLEEGGLIGVTGKTIVVFGTR